MVDRTLDIRIDFQLAFALREANYGVKNWTDANERAHELLTEALNDLSTPLDLDEMVLDEPLVTRPIAYAGWAGKTPPS